MGYPFLPVYVSKATGFFFMVFGVIAAHGGLALHQPGLEVRPLRPSKVTAGSQPDWYMGIAEGLLRIMPNWETHVWGHTISWNVLLPGQVLVFVPFVAVVGWPFLEAWVTGDRREHHLLQRPRDVPTRTAFLAAMITVYGLLWAAGGNDVLATRFHWSLNAITYMLRVAVLTLPTGVRRGAPVVPRAAARRSRARAPRLGNGRDRALGGRRLLRAASTTRTGTCLRPVGPGASTRDLPPASGRPRRAGPSSRPRACPQSAGARAGQRRSRAARTPKGRTEQHRSDRSWWG